MPSSKEARRVKYFKNPDTQRDSNYRRMYGITIEDYERMLVEQEGVCKICNKPESITRNDTIKRLMVDHCHITGKIRGLLCHKCNTGLGNFGDDPDLVRKALGYLKE